MIILVWEMDVKTVLLFGVGGDKYDKYASSYDFGRKEIVGKQ